MTEQEQIPGPDTVRRLCFVTTTCFFEVATVEQAMQQFYYMLRSIDAYPAILEFNMKDVANSEIQEAIKVSDKTCKDVLKNIGMSSEPS